MFHANTDSSVTFLRCNSQANTFLMAQSWHIVLTDLQFHLPCHKCNLHSSPLSSYFETEVIFPFPSIFLCILYHTSKYCRRGKTRMFLFWTSLEKSNRFLCFLCLPPLSLIEKAQVTCTHYVNTGSLLSLALKLGGSIFKESLIQHLIHVALISSALYQNIMKVY